MTLINFNSLPLRIKINILTEIWAASEMIAHIGHLEDLLNSKHTMKIPSELLGKILQILIEDYPKTQAIIRMCHLKKYNQVEDLSHYMDEKIHKNNVKKVMQSMSINNKFLILWFHFKNLKKKIFRHPLVKKWGIY